MKPEINTETEETVQTTDSQAVVQKRLVLHLPDSVGWWWARSKDNPQPGDELCLEVSSVSGNRVIVHYGRDHEYIKPEDSFSSAWFDGMDWIKADSPWQNADVMARRRPVPPT